MARALLLLALVAGLHVATAVIGKRDWRKMDWDKWEKDLEAGDEEELLETEDKIAMKEYDRRRGMGLQMPEDDVQLKDPSEWLKHSQAMTGPAMMFVTLQNTQKGGVHWDKKSLEKIATEWRDLCKTAGLDAQVYDITDPDATAGSKSPSRTPSPAPGEPTPPPTPTPEPKPGRLLVSMSAGWRGYELRDFLLRQPDIAELEWDQVKYTPADLDSEGNFKGGVPAGRAEVPAALRNIPGFSGMPGTFAGAKAPEGKAAKGKARVKGGKPKKRAAEEEEDDTEDWPEDGKKAGKAKGEL